MSRYRRIIPINSEEQERIIDQKISRTIENDPRYAQKLRRPPVPRLPFPIFLARRPLNLPVETRSAREIIVSTCFNLRGICKTIRSFADDMENLLTSVEAVAPVVEGVVAGYTRSLKGKDTPVVEKKQEEADLTRTAAETSDPPIATSAPETQNSQGSTSVFPGKIPTEQELKEFLNNPLVASLLQVAVKNLGPKR